MNIKQHECIDASFDANEREDIRATIGHLNTLLRVMKDNGYDIAKTSDYELTYTYHFEDITKIKYDLINLITVYELERKLCKHYHMSNGVGHCYGQKNAPECYCEGDDSECRVINKESDTDD